MFGNLLKTLRSGAQNLLLSANGSKPSVISNVVGGQTWNKGIDRFGGVMKSPLPENDTLDTPGKLNYVAQNTANEQAARASRNAPSPTPFPAFKYNPAVANAKPAQQSRVAPSLPQRPAVKPQPLGLAKTPIKATPLPVKTTPMKLTPVAARGMATPTPAPQGYNPQWDILEKSIFPITDKAGIPRALVASQWATESGRKTESPINNFFGIGPNWKFNSLEDNVNSYTTTIKHILAAKGADVAKVKDPAKILQLLQQGKTRYEGHNANPLTYVDTVQNTPEWRYYNK